MLRQQHRGIEVVPPEAAVVSGVVEHLGVSFNRRCAMSKLVCAMIATGLILAVGGRCWADDKEEARATIDRAIKATGGEGKLVKLKAMTWKEKGTFYGMG